MTDQDGLFVSLSAGGKKEELAAVGLGEEHVNELMVRIARKLLRDGHRLAFGGTLGDSKNLLTQHLIEAALDWTEQTGLQDTNPGSNQVKRQNADSAEKQNSKRLDVTAPDTWPVVNYAAWPFHTKISDERRADLVGVCQFIDINPDGIDQVDLDALIDDQESVPQKKRYLADALKKMRQMSAADSDLRIVWGGKIEGASGWMAGILEEVAFSIQQDKPVVILGGLGGCSHVLAEFLRKKRAAWPKEQLTLKACADADRDALLSTDQLSDLEKRFATIRNDLTSYRARLHRDKSISGVACDLLREALEVQSPRRAIGIADEAARQRQKFLSKMSSS